MSIIVVFYCTFLLYVCQKWWNKTVKSIVDLMNTRFGVGKILQLDMSTARRCVKSPQSLSGTSIHPTMVTNRSRSWMIISHPFRSMSISPSIPKIRVMGKVKSRSHIVSPGIQPMHLLFISHQSDQPYLRVFDLGKTHLRISKTIWQKTRFKQNPFKI